MKVGGVNWIKQAFSIRRLKISKSGIRLVVLGWDCAENEDADEDFRLTGLYQWWSSDRVFGGAHGSEITVLLLRIGGFRFRLA